MQTRSHVECGLALFKNVGPLVLNKALACRVFHIRHFPCVFWRCLDRRVQQSNKQFRLGRSLPTGWQRGRFYKKELRKFRAV